MTVIGITAFITIELLRRHNRRYRYGVGRFTIIAVLLKLYKLTKLNMRYKVIEIIWE